MLCLEAAFWEMDEVAYVVGSAITDTHAEGTDE
jgi:hypothetical protein